MRNIVRLLRNMIICFTVVFLLALVIILFQIRIESVQALPILSGMRVEELISAARAAFPITVFSTVLLGISYSARRNISVMLSIVCVTLSAMVCSIGLTFAIRAIENMPELPGAENSITLGFPGLIFSQDNRSTIFLSDPGNPQSPQVTFSEGDSLRYIRYGTDLDDTQTAIGFESYPVVYKNFMIEALNEDFRFASWYFQNRLNESFVIFLTYMISLIFLLSSLRFIMDLSIWPLANLFIGILVFRGVLYLNRLVYTEESRYSFIMYFLGEYMPTWAIIPVMFAVTGLILTLFTAFGKTKKRKI